MKNNFRMLRPYLRGLPLIIVSMVIAWMAASKYLHYVTPMYESTAKIRLADIDQGVPNSNLFKDLDVFASSNKIAAEIEVMKSQVLLEKVLQNLDFGIEIYRIGVLKKVELYQNSPVRISIFNWPAEWEEKEFSFMLQEDLSYLMISPDGTNMEGAIGDTLNIGTGQVCIALNEPLLQKRKGLQIADKYSFKVRSVSKLLKELTKGLDISSIDKDVPVIRIAYKSANPEKAALIPNKIAEQYITDYIETKYQAANITVGFLNNQIFDVQRKLTQTETRILDYRNENHITNIRQETETDLRKISQLKIQQTNLKMSLDAIREVEDYVKTGKDNFLDLAPNFEAFTDLLSTEIVKKIKQLQAEKKDLLLVYTPKDEKVKVIDDKLRDLTSYLGESISNTRKNLQIKYTDLTGDIDAASAVFVDVPEKERMLTVLNREFDIFQESYNFLNKKKIEAEIAQAAKIAFHRIISPAEISQEPVSPNRSIIKIVSALLGLIGSLLLIFLVHTMKARVNDADTIESTSLIPIAALIPKLKDKKAIRNHFLKVLHQLEIKKLIGNNKLIGLGGFQYREGMLFAGQHLAFALSQQGRKVLLLKIDPALPAPEQVCSTLNHLEHNLWEMKVYAEAIKQFSQAKLTSLLHGLAADFDHIILINEPLNGQVALTLMSVMDINLFCLDTRLSPAKNILSLGLIQEEFALPQVHILLNRQGYNPNILIESWNVSVKLLRKFHSKIRPHNNA